MFSNTQMKTAGSAFALLAVVAALLVGAAGGAIAADVELANDTVSVSNDTRSVYADVAAGNNSSVNATVTFAGIADGNETVLEERNVTVGAGNSTLVERSNVNASKYGSYRVMVTAQNGTNATAETGKVAEVAGSGGGTVGGAIESAGGIGVVAVAAIALLLILRGRDN